MDYPAWNDLHTISLLVSVNLCLLLMMLIISGAATYLDGWIESALHMISNGGSYVIHHEKDGLYLHWDNDKNSYVVADGLSGAAVFGRRSAESVLTSDLGMTNLKLLEWEAVRIHAKNHIYMCRDKLHEGLKRLKRQQ